MPISRVWYWLDGPKIRHGRSKAFWRNGDGLNIKIDDERGWITDFVTGASFDVLGLIVVARGCLRQDALKWLSSMSGLELDDQPASKEQRQEIIDARQIAEDARFFAGAAILLAEQELENLQDNDSRRSEWTRLIWALKRTPETEYVNWWRRGHGEIAAALVQSGRDRAKRLQRMLAGYLDAEVINATA